MEDTVYSRTEQDYRSLGSQRNMNKNIDNIRDDEEMETEKKTWVDWDDPNRYRGLMELSLMQGFT